MPSLLSENLASRHQRVVYVGIEMSAMVLTVAAFITTLGLWV